MSTPHEKLAAALTALRERQQSGQRVFRSQEFTRLHRERLTRHGFLREVIKGWLISSSPDARDGESTPWYASFWEFCSRYCDARFGGAWHLSPEISLLLHAENTVIPSQVIVHSPQATNHKTPLLFGTSLYDLRLPQMPPLSDLTVRDGLRIFTPAASLIRVPEDFFRKHPIESQVLLGSMHDPSDLLHRLLMGGHSVVAGRIVGAFRRIERPEIADEIARAMKAADYVVRETDPFAERAPIAPPASQY